MLKRIVSLLVVLVMVFSFGGTVFANENIETSAAVQSYFKNPYDQMIAKLGDRDPAMTAKLAEMRDEYQRTLELNKSTASKSQIAARGFRMASVDMDSFESSKTIQVSSKGAHTLALKKNGTVWAWGSNNHGQAGDGSYGPPSVPTKVKNLSNIVQISAGYNHSLALDGDGNVYGWGYNLFGQIDSDASGYPNTPIHVAGIPAMQRISTGGNHSVALDLEGNVWTWGEGSGGQLGTGEGVPWYCNPPTIVQGIGEVSRIAAGEGHTLALTTQGEVYAWGNCGEGQIGANATSNQFTPVKIINSDTTALMGITDIAAGGRHSIALNGTTHKVYVWGENREGQLGNGNTMNSTYPIEVTGIPDVEAIVAGPNNTAIITTDKQLYAWGSNWASQLGDGTKINRSTPIHIDSVSDITGVSMGDAVTAIESNGTVWVWGHNGENGRLGIGKSKYRLNAYKVNGLENIVEISSGNYHGIALDTYGDVYTWGSGGYMQLGTGSWNDELFPVKINGLPPVKAIAAGDWHNVVLGTDGKVYSWGWSCAKGSTPDTVDGLVDEYGNDLNIVYIDTGFTEAAAVTDTGEVYTWGWDDRLFGYPNPPDSTYKYAQYTASKVVGLEGVVIKSVSVGMFNMVAVADNGDVYIWGDNQNGQIQDGTRDECRTPYKIGALSNVSDATVSYNQMVAKNDGSVWVWGYDGDGTLGLGTEPLTGEEEWNGGWERARKDVTQSVNYPTVKIEDKTIEPNRNWRTIASHYNAAAVIATDGSVWTCGLNEAGKLGDGTFLNRNIPVKVNGMSDAVSLSVSHPFMLALKADGTVWSWGECYLMGVEIPELSYVPIKLCDYTPSAASRNITDVDEISDKENVSLGTSFEALGLPSTIGVTLEDGSRVEDVVIENWASTPTYNSEVAGMYAFIGTLAQTAGISNINSLTATVTVTVIDNIPPIEAKIVAGNMHVVGLSDTGKIYVSGSESNYYAYDEDTWEEYLMYNPLDVDSWGNETIIDIEAKGNNTVALTDDGRVLACGEVAEAVINNVSNKTIIEGWHGIKEIYVGYYIIVARNEQKQVHCVYLPQLDATSQDYMQGIVSIMTNPASGWNDVDEMALGESHGIGVKNGSMWSSVSTEFIDYRTMVYGLFGITSINASSSVSACVGNITNGEETIKGVVYLTGYYNNNMSLSMNMQANSPNGTLDQPLLVGANKVSLSHSKVAILLDTGKIKVIDLAKPNQSLAMQFSRAQGTWAYLEDVAVSNDFIVGLKDTGSIVCEKVTDYGFGNLSNWDLITKE